MADFRIKFFTGSRTITYPNLWDMGALCIILAVLVLLAWSVAKMSVPYHIGQPLHLSLDPSHLPSYALQTVTRMIVALGCSLLFTFIFGTMAAKSRQAEQIIIPFIDVMQSLPVLGMISLTVVGFIKLFPNSLLGPECAAIFAIFTSQAWNMALSFYQSIRTVPSDLMEAARMFHLSAWQRYWRIEVPFAMPGLLWNMMMSMSASWFFLTVSESITVSGQNIVLPGLGSYIGMAIKEANIVAVGYVIITMFVVIVLYDQLFFRPLLAWAGKFRMEEIAREEENIPFFTQLLRRSHLLEYINNAWESFTDKFINFAPFRQKPANAPRRQLTRRQMFYLVFAWQSLIAVLFIGALYILIIFLHKNISWHEFLHVAYLGVFTAIRVFVVLVVSSLIWVPVGVWIGLRTNLAEKAQPIVQLLASFPANLVYPVIVSLVVYYHLNVEIWVTVLMMLGAQWYVLFNVIAGTMALPKDLRQATDNLGLRGWLWWRKFILPGIFPYYITGAITAVGGAWNTCIVAEIPTWGDKTLEATGLGAYITQVYHSGNFPALVLGMSVMCFFVLTLNRLVWRKVYLLAITRYTL